MRILPWAIAAAVVVLLCLDRWEGKTLARIDAREDSLAAISDHAARLAAGRARLRPPVVEYRTRWRSYGFDSTKVARGPETLCVPKAVILTADALDRATERLQDTTDALADTETEHAAMAERQADDWKGVARGRWLQPSVTFLVAPGTTPALRLDGGVTLGRGRSRVVVLGTMEADAEKLGTRLWVGIQRTF